MLELIKKFVSENKYYIIAFVIGFLVIYFYFQNQNVLPADKGMTSKSTENLTQNTKANKEIIKKAEIINFGRWTSNQNREILAKVISDSEVEVQAEINGNIFRVFGEIGQKVYRGQVLANFKLSGDTTYIQYQNSLNDLATTKVSAQNTIKSGEINVKNAENLLEQTKSQQEQNYQKSFKTLITKTRNAENIFYNALKFTDRYLGATKKFQSTHQLGRFEIGRNQSIQRNNTLNNIRNISQKFEHLSLLSPHATENDKIIYAEERIVFGKTLQNLLQDFDSLVRNASTNKSFPESSRVQVQSQTETQKTLVSNEIFALQNQLENAKNAKEMVEIALLQAENQIKNAEAQLEISKSQAQSQITSSQNRVATNAAARQDLSVRSPITGTISEKNIYPNQHTNPGQKLFTIINDDAPKKVEAFLNMEEWEKIKQQSEILVKIYNGDILKTKKKFISTKVDSTTQKIKTEFLLPKTDALVGSFVKIIVPLSSTIKNQIPLSSISFEPDGAEVFVLNSQNIIERKKIKTGQISGNSIEVLEGLKENEKVIKFQSRFEAGEKVEI